MCFTVMLLTVCERKMRMDGPAKDRDLFGRRLDSESRFDVAGLLVVKMLKFIRAKLFTEYRLYKAAFRTFVGPDGRRRHKVRNY